MRTRSKETGQTPPAKKGSKTPVKADSAVKEPLANPEPELTSEVKVENANKDENKSKDPIVSPVNQQEETPVKKVSTSEEAESEAAKEPEAIEIPDNPDKAKVEVEHAAEDTEMEAVDGEEAVEEDVPVDDASEEEMEEEEEEEVEEEEVEEEEVVQEIEGEDADNDEGVENQDEVEDNNEEEEEEEQQVDEEEDGYEEVEDEEMEAIDSVEEHPELQEAMPVTDRQKRKKLEVFVGGLDKEATEDDIKRSFENVGEVVEVRLTKNPQTGKNKGYCFVRFATADLATRAVNDLKEIQIKGKTCRVVPSQDNDVLFIGSINKSWKKEQVEEKLNEYGIDGIEELTVMDDILNEGFNRGFAFLQLATHNDALKAFRILAKPNVFFGSERPARISWAQHNEPDAGVMAKVKAVFVDGIIPSWTEAKVKELFEKHGEIEHIILAHNLQKSKRDNFAFVHYTSHDAAVACIDFLKDNPIVDGENKIKVRARLVKPLPKVRPGRADIRGRSLPARVGDRGGGLRGRIMSRRPVSSGRAPARPVSRSLGHARQAYKPLPPRPLKAIQQRQLGRQRPLRAERLRDRRPLGGPPPPSRPSARHRFPRQDDMPRGRATGYLARPNYDYRTRYEDTRDDFPPRGAGFSNRSPVRRHSVRHSVPAPRDGYVRHVDRDQGYGRSPDGGFNRPSEYNEPSAPLKRSYDEPRPGFKRPYSSMDDGMFDSGPSGYAKSRVNYEAPHPPPQYVSSKRTPVGRPTVGGNAGRSPLPLLSTSQSSFGTYDQSGAIGSGRGSGSLYRTGNYGYGSVLPGTGVSGDYASTGTETRGSSLYGSRTGTEARGSSLYGSRTGSVGYGYSGAGATGSYY